MAKKTQRKKLIEKLDKIFSVYIRLREAKAEIAQCFTCGKKDHYKKLQNGHFQSRKHYSTRWDEINCQVQCSGCNLFRFGEQYLFGVNLDKKYGTGTSDEMHKKSRETYKIDNYELGVLITKYEDLVKELLKV